MSKDSIQELLRLLSCNCLEADELDTAVDFVLNAAHEPELAWLSDPDRAMTFAVYDRLSDFIAEGDKIDELHERLSATFSEPLPPFPFDDSTVTEGASAYLAWANDVLAKRGLDGGGYVLVAIDIGLDDQLRVLPVYRKHVVRILQLARELSLRIREAI